VFFDFNRADLTDRARQIIAEARAERAARRRDAPRGLWATPTAPARRSTTSASPSAAPRPWPPELERRGRRALEHGRFQAFGESRPARPDRRRRARAAERRVEIVLR
jgi:hypothetical protein